MILAETHGVVEKSGDVNKPTSFTIKASRKAFEILSANMYSDKILAIVRELSTNAADAHIAAGKADTQFIVHLPNTFEPWFSVQDFGTGLSHEAMLSIYTTYFDSNKTNSNDVTGCLGLGSKTPFAYTDSFTVESRYNGVLSIYTAYLEDGLPAISRLSHVSTTEPNGLTVKFPVKTADYRSFLEKAQQALVWFKNKPKITGNTFTYPQNTYLLKNEKFGVYKNAIGRSYVVMGNVAYPVSSYDFLNDYDPQNDKMKKILSWGIELYVNIGDVDIAASREKLGYDKRTVKFLKARLEEALLDLQREVTKDIASKPTLWEARRALNEVRQSFTGFNFIAQWGGNDIHDFVKVTERKVASTDPANPGIFSRPNAAVETMKVKHHRSGGGITVKKERTDIITANGNKIFLNDDRGGFAAVRRYLEEKGYGTSVYVISDYHADWLKETGLDTVVVKTSTLPKPERRRGERGSSLKAKLYEYVPQGNSSNGNNNAGYWTPAEVEVEDGGVYVEILYFAFRMQDGEATQNPAILKDTLKLLKKLGKDVKLYGIRPADRAMLEKSDGDWQSLKEYAKEVLKEQEALYPEFIKAKELDEINGGAGYYRYSQRIPFGDFNGEKFNPESDFGRFVVRSMEASKAQLDETIKAYGELRRWCGIHLSDTVDLTGLKNAHEALYKKYPLIQYLDPYRGGDDYVKDITAYVNLLDNLEASKPTR